MDPSVPEFGEQNSHKYISMRYKQKNKPCVQVKTDKNKEDYKGTQKRSKRSIISPAAELSRLALGAILCPMSRLATLVTSVRGWVSPCTSSYIG